MKYAKEKLVMALQVSAGLVISIILAIIAMLVHFGRNV